MHDYTHAHTLAQNTDPGNYLCTRRYIEDDYLDCCQQRRQDPALHRLVGARRLSRHHLRQAACTHTCKHINHMENGYTPHRALSV
jgi:hypothetical protein